MKKLFLFLILSSSFIFLESCSSLKDSSSNLVVALSGSEIESLDPSLMETDSGSYRIGLHIYSRLTQENHDGTFTKGDITERIQKISKNTYRFTLKNKIYFSDRSLLTADDVLFSLLRAKSSPSVSRFFTLIKDVKKISPRIINIITYFDTNHLYDSLSQVPASIISKSNYLKNPTRFLLHPVGSGAFYVKKWSLGNEIVLAPNPYYINIRSLKKSYQNLIFKWIPNSTARLYALETNSVDVAFDLSPNDAKQKMESQSSSVKILTQPSLTMNYLGLNNNKIPFNNAEIRKILYTLLDRDAITEAAYHGFATTACNFITSLETSRCVLPKPIFSNNQKILSSLKKQPLVLLIQANEKRQIMAQVIAEQLRQKGISLKIVSLDWAPFITALTKGQFDLFIYPESARFLFPSYFLETLLAPQNKNFTGNLVGYENLSITKLLMELEESMSSKEENEILNKINTDLLQDMPFIPLNFANQIVGYTKNIHNFFLNPDSMINFNDTIKSKDES